MGANTFGNLFKIMTWGESHGKAIGVVIDGCPAGLELNEEDIQKELLFRRPGNNPFTSPRQEPDRAEIFSGLFEGKTTGAPISIIIFNRDVDSRSYEPLRDHLRPGHASFTYLAKYGHFDFRGGGRASGRETAARVAAGAVAKKILLHYGIQVVAYLSEVGGVGSSYEMPEDLNSFQERVHQSPIFCPDPKVSLQMMETIQTMQQAGDSTGGIVEVLSSALPVGLGDPIYQKLEANLATAMLSIPASKGFEMGKGFESARMKGSEHNDRFSLDAEERITLKTNHAGGTLAGVSTGQPLQFRIAFKPTSSIKKPQETVTAQGKPVTIEWEEGARHDPCVAIRAVPVVKSMTELVLVDAILMNKCCKLLN